MIQTTYDPEADVLNVRFGPLNAGSDGHQEVAPGVYVEFDHAGNSAIGIEVTSVMMRQAARGVAKDAAE